VIHFDHDTGIEAFPFLIRRDSGLMEFICQHGVGHPVASSAHYLSFLWQDKDDNWSVHGCDGCCGREDFPDIEYIPARLLVVRGRKHCPKKLKQTGTRSSSASIT